MTTSESKGRFFFTKRIDLNRFAQRIDSNRELECSSKYPVNKPAVGCV